MRERSLGLTSRLAFPLRLFSLMLAFLSPCHPPLSGPPVCGSQDSRTDSMKAGGDTSNANLA